MNGATALSRNYELNLESSAAHAIDSDSTTFWGAPEGANVMTAIFALPARTRITGVGVTTPLRGGYRPRNVRYEWSLDGERWTQLTWIETRADAAPQFFDVTPTEASFLRITPANPENIMAVRTLHVHGTELESPPAASLDGCWTINGLPTRIVQNGARIIGVIGDEQPMFIDGGSEGRVVRLLWTKLPQFGFAMLSVSPDGKHLSGVRWHEEPAERTAGDAWFGVRGPCAKTPLGGGHIIGTFFRRAGRYPLYGLRFDKGDSLDVAASAAALGELASIIAQAAPQRVRIRAHEFRETTSAANRARAEKRLASLRAALASRGADLARITFVAAGDTAPLHRPVNAGMRAMGSTIDLQLQ